MNCRGQCLPLHGKAFYLILCNFLAKNAIFGYTLPGTSISGFIEAYETLVAAHKSFKIAAVIVKLFDRIFELFVIRPAAKITYSTLFDILQKLFSAHL